MQALNYATNADKTEKQFFVSGINCEPKTALKQMIKTKRNLTNINIAKKIRLWLFMDINLLKKEKLLQK